LKSLLVELPPEVIALLGSEEDAKGDAKVAVVFDLVRRGRLSRARAAELLGLALWDLPAQLSEYRIPWFDYSPGDLARDLDTLRATHRRS
jgi:predicted HTH domain antitoxin